MEVFKFNGFFSQIQYAQELEDKKSWTSFAERTSDLFRAPRRWLVEEWTNKVNDNFIGTAHESMIAMTSTGVRETITIDKMVKFQTNDNGSRSLAKKILRFAIGFFLAAPGEILGSIAMGVAFLSKEIRLKHTWAVRELTNEEKLQLKNLVEERQKLPTERQGANPVRLLIILCCLTFLLIYRYQAPQESN